MNSFLKASMALVLATALLAIGCEKEPGLTPEPHRPQSADQNFVGAFTDSGDENDLDSIDLDVLCFTFVFPVSVTYPDGNTVAYESDTSLYNAIDSWYESNVESDQDPMIVFPVSVTFEDGTVQEVTNDEDLCDLFFSCYDDWEDEEAWEDFEEDEWEDECDDFDHDDCFEIQFPIMVRVGDTTYTFGSWEEADSVVYDLIEDLVEGEELDAELVFPINLLVDGEVVVINTEADLEAIEDDCYDEEDCFSIVFPMTLNFPDGSQQEVNSEDELDTAIDDWEKANPNNDDDDIVPTFPFDVINMDSVTVSVLNLEQLEKLEEECED